VTRVEASPLPDVNLANPRASAPADPAPA
jgi:hypothetical protein